MAVITYPLISLEYLKTFISVRDNVTEYDTPLREVTTLATRQLETFTNRFFSKQEFVELANTKNTLCYKYDLFGDNETGLKNSGLEQQIKLNGLNIDKNADFKINYSNIRDFTSENTLISDKYYYLDNDAGILYLNYPTRQGLKFLQVTYTSGYEASGNPLHLTDSIPPDLKQACVYQSMFLWNSRNLDSLNMEDDRIDGSGGSTKKIQIGGVVLEAVKLLTPYKRLNFGVG